MTHRTISRCSVTEVHLTPLVAHDSICWLPIFYCILYCYRSGICTLTCWLPRFYCVFYCYWARICTWTCWLPWFYCVLLLQGRDLYVDLLVATVLLCVLLLLGKDLYMDLLVAMVLLCSIVTGQGSVHGHVGCHGFICVLLFQGKDLYMDLLVAMVLLCSIVTGQGSVHGHVGCHGFICVLLLQGKDLYMDLLVAMVLHVFYCYRARICTWTCWLPWFYMCSIVTGQGSVHGPVGCHGFTCVLLLQGKDLYMDLLLAMVLHVFYCYRARICTWTCWLPWFYCMFYCYRARIYTWTCWLPWFYMCSIVTGQGSVHGPVGCHGFTVFYCYRARICTWTCWLPWFYCVLLLQGKDLYMDLLVAMVLHVCSIVTGQGSVHGPGQYESPSG